MIPNTVVIIQCQICKTDIVLTNEKCADLEAIK